MHGCYTTKKAKKKKKKRKKTKTLQLTIPPSLGQRHHQSGLLTATRKSVMTSRQSADSDEHYALNNVLLKFSAWWRYFYCITTNIATIPWLNDILQRSNRSMISLQNNHTSFLSCIMFMSLLCSGLYNAILFRSQYASCCFLYSFLPQYLEIWNLFNVWLLINPLHRPAVRAVPRSCLEREIWGSNLGLVKSDAVLSTACHRCDISSKGSVLAGGNNAETGHSKLVTRFVVMQRTANIMKHLIFDL